ncbi:hypothetical protein [Actinomadura rugatobispora]|uniref:Uncharacterized protein n=1 Tax=Actinomadura rugatobispora TaxID=1994 RepID=A0ABW0ZZW1_9ACTN
MRVLCQFQALAAPSVGDRAPLFSTTSGTARPTAPTSTPPATAAIST